MAHQVLSCGIFDFKLLRSLISHIYAFQAKNKKIGMEEPLWNSRQALMHPKRQALPGPIRSMAVRHTPSHQVALGPFFVPCLSERGVRCSLFFVPVHNGCSRAFWMARLKRVLILANAP
jgi:hypothetical protein